MEEIMKLVIGIVFVLLGVPVGNWLAKVTKEELKAGQKWFKIIIWVGIIGGFVGLVMANDVVMFSFFFIVVVTSRSLR